MSFKFTGMFHHVFCILTGIPLQRGVAYFTLSLQIEPSGIFKRCDTQCITSPGSAFLPSTRLSGQPKDLLRPEETAEGVKTSICQQSYKF